MKLIPFIIPLTAVFASASLVPVRYDSAFDDPDASLSTVACSDGENGLLTKGFHTFGDLPTFSNIGGAFAIEGYNSPFCGTCWNLTDAETATTAFIIAIDYAKDGFVIAESALSALGGPQAVIKGKIYTSAMLVDGTHCGL